MIRLVVNINNISEMHKLKKLCNEVVQSFYSSDKSPYQIRSMSETLARLSQVSGSLAHALKEASEILIDAHDNLITNEDSAIADIINHVGKEIG